MKIIHAANFSLTQNGAVYYSMDRKITNGLIRNGHMVHDFSYRDMTRFAGWFRTTRTGRKEMAAALKDTVGRIRPDILLLGHSELLTPEDLQDCRAICPEMKLAMWWVDPLDRIDHIKARMGILDVLFATTGTAPLHTALKDSRGTRLVFFPNITDSSIETGRSFLESECRHDLVFIGRTASGREDLVGLLRQLSPEMNVGLYGQDSSSLVFGSEFVDILSSSRMGISYSRYNDIPYYTSDRIAQLTGNGVLTFSPRVPGMTDLFSEEEVVYFSGLGELREKIVYFRNHPQHALRIAENGWEKAHTAFNERRVAAFMTETVMGLPISQPCVFAV